MKKKKPGKWIWYLTFMFDSEIMVGHLGRISLQFFSKTVGPDSKCSAIGQLPGVSF